MIAGTPLRNSQNPHMFGKAAIVTQRAVNRRAAFGASRSNAELAAPHQLAAAHPELAAPASDRGRVAESLIAVNVLKSRSGR